jgi:ATP-dependent RNA helicase RhlE
VVSNIEQQYIEVPNFKTKVNLLEHLLAKSAFEKTIVFINSKSTATSLTKYLNRKTESEVRVLHSNKSQNARINAIKDFEDNIVNVLVTTDVFSRGIDVKGVSHVINFELPFQYESYVHRIGRTGRADKSGVAVSFCNSAEMLHLKKIEELIKQEIQELPFPEEVTIEQTPKQEQIDIERVIDTLKRKADPTFSGAFHEKKKKHFDKKVKKRR